jgi:VWFA-related protein
MPISSRKGPYIAVFPLVLLAIILPAQNPAVPEKPDSPQIEPPSLSNSTDIGKALQPDPNLGMMRLDLSVTDEKGNFVTGLNESDFTLLDNGEPRQIVTFNAIQGAASSDGSQSQIILVIDEIDTPPVLLSSIEQAARKFLLQNGGKLSQPAMVYRISSEGLFASFGPSYDGNLLAQQISRRKESRTVWTTHDIASSQWNPYGSTEDSRQIVTLAGSSPASRSSSEAQWKTLPHALIALGSIAIEARRSPERKVLFWIGSPWPVVPSIWKQLFDTATELSTRLREARISIWFGGFPWLPDEDAFAYQNFLKGATSDESTSIENLALQVLAVQSGGGELKGEGDASELISKLAAQASAFYTITFDPPRTETLDEYHELKVTTAKHGLTVKTRTGYYNEPSYYDQPRNAVERISVAQLRNAMSELQRESEDAAERRLKQMELTERLSSADLSAWLPTLKGRNAREALIALADQSAFLSPPDEDTLDQPPPTLHEQHEIIQRTVSYVSRMVPILPNLNTDRTTTLYSEPPRIRDQTWKAFFGTEYVDAISTSKAAVHVSRGKEVVQEASTSLNPRTYNGRKIIEKRSLQTEGTFGPILASLLIAVSKPGSRLMWARWEKGRVRLTCGLSLHYSGEIAALSGWILLPGDRRC